MPHIKKRCFRYMPKCLSVWPWALLSVTANAIFIENPLLHSWKGMVGSEGRNWMLTRWVILIIIIIITMAQQPYMGLLGRAHSWQLVTGQLAALLFYRSWCDRQSHLGDLGEKWRLWISIHARKSTTWDRRLYFPSEFLSSYKIHRPRSGSNPRTLGPVASTLTTSPPRSTG
jgi:hypothetical protein